MKLAVCGDSWFSSDLDHPGESFGEQLAQRHSFDLLSLARGGCSNFAIALQINKAIELGAEFVITGATSCDRIEIPRTRKKFEQIKDFFNWHNWYQTPTRSYDKIRGISNVKYKNMPYISSQYTWMSESTIISESINNLAFQENNYHFYADELDQERVDALKAYLVHLYDDNIKRQYDAWIMSDAVRRLVASKIPFLFVTYPLFEHEWYEDISWVPRDNLINATDFNYYTQPQGPQRFHMSQEGASNFANYLESRIKKKGLL